MTIEQLCCICFGMMIQTLTFALGIVVGASMRKKDFSHATPEPGTASPDPLGRYFVGGKPR